MARKFDIPVFYSSSIISSIKRRRGELDPRKRDLLPSQLDLGTIAFKIPRHFGFCYGVQNAIEIAFRAIDENPGRRIFLLSEMIHNPLVNEDLQARGVRFLLSPSGEQLIPFEDLCPDDIVIVPAFGTTVELFERLKGMGIDPKTYNTTCPFVEKVWNRSRQLGEQGFTVIIHGKHYHEETRATFSHARLTAPSVVIRDMEEARRLGRYVSGEGTDEEFVLEFAGKYSEGFLASRDLVRVGVVNQTTMLAGETQAIGDYFKGVMLARYGESVISHHIADTRDTLCYATAENQNAIQSVVQSGADLAIVVGGYNSSNTFHLAKLCRDRMPTYHICGAEEIVSLEEIRHFNPVSMGPETSRGWFPFNRERVSVILTAGASSPDTLVDAVVHRVAELLGVSDRIPLALEAFTNNAGTATEAESRASGSPL